MALGRHIWGPDLDRNGAYFDWKYRDNPNLGPDGMIYFVVLHDDTVVGMRGLHPIRLQADGPDKLTALCWGDAVVDPQHRGNKLLTPLTDALLAKAADMGYRHVFGVSNNPATFFHLTKLGWKPAVPYLPLHRYAGSKGILFNAFQFARQMPILSTLAGALQHGARHKRIGAFADDTDVFGPLDEADAQQAPVTIASSPQPEAMADLARRLNGDARISLVKDAAYLGWRFDNPLAMHRFLYCGDPALDGYLVVQTKRFGNFGLVNLVDWEAESIDVMRALLRTLLTVGRFRSLATWSAGLSSQTLALLRKEGFKTKEPAPADGDYRQGLIFGEPGSHHTNTPWTLGRRDLLNPADWNLRMILSDGY